jgi:hypothetical protein
LSLSCGFGRGESAEIESVSVLVKGVNRATALLRRSAFEPELLPADIVLGLALTPAVIAGLVLFRLPAAEMLLLALSIGGIAHISGRLLRLDFDRSPLLPAVIGVALIGPGASIGWALAVATLAGALELGRVRFLPRLRFEAGVVAYSILFLAGRSQPASYINPQDQRPFPEPIGLWLTSFQVGSAPIDPVRLYVGNVAGPVFATSLLAVGLGLAWLWYARRLSLGVLFCFLIGALVPVLLFNWNVVFHLDSGPTWFVAGFVLADRKLLPAGRFNRLLLGLAAGLAATGLRTKGLAIEAVPLTVAGLQLTVAFVEGVNWLIEERARVRAALKRLRGRIAGISFGGRLARKRTA